MLICNVTQKDVPAEQVQKLPEQRKDEGKA